MPTRTIEQYAAFMLDKNINYNFQGLGNRHPDALIKLRAADGWQAWVYLLAEEPTLSHTHDDVTKRVTAFLPARQYTWLMDLLRNEGPAYFQWGSGRFEVWTGWEEAGISDLD